MTLKQEKKNEKNKTSHLKYNLKNENAQFKCTCNICYGVGFFLCIYIMWVMQF